MKNVLGYLCGELAKQREQWTLTHLLKIRRKRTNKKGFLMAKKENSTICCTKKSRQAVCIPDQLNTSQTH